jgi:PAS domain S-box-containing protein
LLLIPCQLFALDPAKSLFQYNCLSWTHGDGLSANGINAITQTRDGFLWVGTQRGLVRFDGTEFRAFNLPDQLHFRNQIISTLAGPADGSLWFGIRNGSFGCYNKKNGFFSPTNGAWVEPAMNVIALREVSDGSVWIGTDSGTARWVKGNSTQTNFYEQLAGVTAIYEDSHHRIWLGTAEHGLYYWEAGQLTNFPDASLAKASVAALAEDAFGQIWVATKFGLLCYDANFQPKEHPPVFSDVKALLVDRHGTLWIGTTGEGLIRFQNGAFSSLRKTDGLPGDDVSSLFEDNEGSLWIGTRKGLSQLTDVKLPLYSSTEGLLAGGYHDVCRAADGGLWVATSHGISHFDGRQATNYSSEAGLGVPYIKRVFQARDGDVYAVNGNKEIEILSEGKVVAKHTSTAWPTGFAEDDQSVVVSVGGNLFRVSRSQFMPYAYEGTNTPPLYWIRNLFSCPDGSILVASVNGIFRLKDGKFEQWSVENGLADRNVLWVSEDADGTVWAGLTTGISRLKDGKITNIRKDDGLFDNFINAIVPDDHGWLWMNSSRGIFRISRRCLDNFINGATNHVQCASYDGQDGAKSLDTTEVEYAGCKTSDGRIWFPSHQGVVMIDPTNLITNPVLPPVHIQQVRANGVEITADNHPELLPGKGELEFQFIAVSFIAPQKTRFRYQLEGYDHTWVEAGERRSAFYTNLKPKHYTFRVQACNASGVWNTVGDSFEVGLPPHYYQRASFMILCGLLALGALSGIYGWRVEHLRQRQKNLQAANEMLESNIRLRTSELANSLSLTRATLESTADGILVVDGHGKVTSLNEKFLHMWQIPPELADASDEQKMMAVALPQLKTCEQYLSNIKELGAHPENESFDVLEFKDGRIYERYSKPQRIAEQTVGRVWSFRDITERKRAEAELDRVHRQLLSTSRQAGMAEVATSVLHNVGNVLNSVNVSAAIVANKVKNSGGEKLSKALALLREREKNSARFLAGDEKGKQLINYLQAFSEHLAEEKAAVSREMDCLVKNIEHIKEIVSMQQTYARVAGVEELVKTTELVEDSLRMHTMAFERHLVRIRREYSDDPTIMVDRHKVIQILVNLLQNAKYACEENRAEDRKIVVRIARVGTDRVKIEVADNGMGISPENLIRIFSHGFTTRKNGHGFGLHSGALAAKEIGGSLTAHSDGPGKGATFTLELPVQRKPRPSEPVSDRHISVDVVARN